MHVAFHWYILAQVIQEWRRLTASSRNEPTCEEKGWRWRAGKSARNNISECKQNVWQKQNNWKRKWGLFYFKVSVLRENIKKRKKCERCARILRRCWKKWRKKSSIKSFNRPPARRKPGTLWFMAGTLTRAPPGVPVEYKSVWMNITKWNYKIIIAKH